MKARDYRKIASKALSGNWFKAIITTFIAGFFGIFGTVTVSNSSNVQSGVDGAQQYVPQVDLTPIIDFLETSEGQIVLVIIGYIAIVAFVLVIIKFIFGGAATIGYRYFTAEIVRTNEASMGKFFGKFNMVWKGFIYLFLYQIRIFLWTLLFIIPGIVKSYAYAMTPYILADNPNMKVTAAFKLSQILMKGNKWKLFCLELSFIGWDLLNLVTLGISDIWVHPYKEVAAAAFYHELTKDYPLFAGSEF